MINHNPEVRTVNAALDEGLDQADFRAQALAAAATRKLFSDIGADLRGIKGLGVSRSTSAIKNLTDEVFGDLYNPYRPSIGCTLRCRFRETGLWALAAHELRDKGENAPNVIFIPPPALGVCSVRNYENGRSTLVVRRGVMIDGRGQAYEGAFPEPVEIDLIATFSARSNFLLERGEQLGLRFLNTGATMNVCRNKVQAGARFAEAGICHPLTLEVAIPPNDTVNEAKLSRRIADFVTDFRFDEVVVKPNHGSKGNNVTFHKPRDIEGISKAIKSLRVGTNRTAVVQEYVPSFPINLYAESGPRLDWNGRFLATELGIVDQEVRLAEKGKPVNKDKGAGIIEFDEAVKLLRPKQMKRYETWLQMADEAAIKIANCVGGGLLGHDFVFDPEGQIWCLESNGQAAGGMKSLAQIREGREAKLKAPVTLLRHIERLHFTGFQPSRVDEKFTETPLFRSPLESPSLVYEMKSLLNSVKSLSSALDDDN